MAVRETERHLSEAELNNPDLDDDGQLDVEYYPIPSASEEDDPQLAEAWDEALRLIAGDQDEVEKARGEPCKQGEAAARTGCIPRQRPKPRERPNTDRHNPDSVAQRIQRLFDKGGLSYEEAQETKDILLTMKKADIVEVKRKLGLKGSGNKQQLADQISQLAMWKLENEDGRPGRGAEDGGEPAGDRRPVAGEAEKPNVRGDGQAGPGEYIPVGEKTPRRIPREVEQVSKRLDRYEELFRESDNHKAADWMGMLREHVNSVGVEEALASLGPEVAGLGEQVQYGGYNLEGNGDVDFIRNYLGRAGVGLISGGTPVGETRAISTVTPSSDEEGLRARGDNRDFFPTLQTLKNKLDEAQHLPGLEKSEDLGKLMGGELGSVVPSFSPEALKKLDETYGEGGWIVKSYGDEAYAGYGVFFPQRAKQLQQEAQGIIWDSGRELANYGFQHLRDDKGKIVGIKHGNGDEYRFGTDKYNSTIQGDARRAADMVGQDRAVWDPSNNKEIKVGSPADSEHGAAIPAGSFMAQPAFPVVGVSDEERARGITFKEGQEGRVHIVTRNGKAEIIPHSTWLKKQPLPVVFESEDTKAMAQAALDAINALPETERQNQLYAPDIVKTKDGYKVVEANPANEAGASGYLQDNPLIIDSYVSHLTGREPQHVRFIRELLAKRERKRSFRIRSRKVRSVPKFQGKKRWRSL